MAPRSRRRAVTAGLVGVALLMLSLLLLPPFWGKGAVNHRDVRAPDWAPDRETAALVERLRDTRLVNGREVYARLRLNGGETKDGTDAGRGRGAAGFLTRSPFVPAYRESFESLETLRYALPDSPHSYELSERDGTFAFRGQEPVLRWYEALSSDLSVCAVRFLDSGRRDYRLGTFQNRESAVREGYVVTHRRHCGTCSSLQDLAIYMARPDLLSPVSRCARRLTRRGVKACLMETVGFTERCAETWTYNALHTRRHCIGACIRHYGFWSLLTNDVSGSRTDGQGNLNPCLHCDEHASGPGFKYAAGRTRRSSGLKSAIDRPPAEIYAVDHGLYFGPPSRTLTGRQGASIRLPGTPHRATLLSLPAGPTAPRRP